MKQGVFGCFEVTIGFNGKERCDFITYDTKGIWRCYEIKSSVEDFRSKAKHTFCGNYNYYVMNEYTYEKVKSEIDKNIGVYITRTGEGIFCIKNPKKQNLKISEKVLKDSLIRSLFREASKYHEVDDEDKIKKLKRQVSYQKSLYKEYYRKYWNLLRQTEDKYGTDWDRN